MFTYQTQIFIHQTDADGRLFFANQFYLMQEALEKMKEGIGLPLKGILDHPTLTFPVVHAEAGYSAMLQAGDRVTVEVGVEKIGQTSVTFAYVIRKKDGTPAGSGKTINVCVDKNAWKKAALPEEWRSKFEKALLK